MTRRNRRDFLKITSVAGTGILTASSGFWSGAALADEPRRLGPNDRLNVAFVGVGGRGGSNLGGISPKWPF